MQKIDPLRIEFTPMVIQRLEGPLSQPSSIIEMDSTEFIRYVVYYFPTIDRLTSHNHTRNIEELRETILPRRERDSWRIG